VNIKEWAAFWLLGLIWGTSFLWIKIAVGHLPPLTVAALRLGIGLVGLLAIVAARRQPFPRDLRTLRAYVTLGAAQSAIPFGLIAWGETKIGSGLAAILNGTTPLFTIVIAHLWLHDEKITPARTVGLAAGFAGVVVLGSRDLGPHGLQDSAWGQAALLGASLSYAVAATYARKRLRGEPPLVQATMVVLTGDLLLWGAVATAERPLHLAGPPIVWIGLAWLGLLGSCVAYLLYFFLINTWGATRASLVTYVFPVVGLLLGITVLGEPADWRLWLGSLLVIAGILATSARPRPAGARA